MLYKFKHSNTREIHSDKFLGSFSYLLAEKELFRLHVRDLFHFCKNVVCYQGPVNLE